MQANSWHHKLFHFLFVLLNLESVENKGKNYKNLNILRTKKSFLDEITNMFLVFEGLSLGEEIKTWYNVADTSFKQ